MNLIDLNDKWVSEPTYFNDWKHCRELIREQWNLKGADTAIRWANCSEPEKTIVVDWFVLPKNDRHNYFFQVYGTSETLYYAKYRTFAQQNGLARTIRYQVANAIIGAYITPSTAINISGAIAPFKYETNYVLYGLESYAEDGVHGQIHDWLNGEGVFAAGQTYESIALNNIAFDVYPRLVSEGVTVQQVRDKIKNIIINGER